MKSVVVGLVLVGLGLAGNAVAQDVVAPSQARLKVAELALLPVGLTVTHAPDPVAATPHESNISGVQWQYSTTVSAVAGPVTIIEFGYFVQRDGRWEHPYGTEIPDTYTTVDFARKYDCPDAEVKTGQSYTDLQNRSVIDCVPEQMVRWYFIGLDAQGKRVKGVGDVRLLARQDPPVQGTHW